MLVLPHERVDDLQFNNLKVIQNPAWFCFGVDAVLLADFTPKGDFIVDFGTGCGIVPILLAGKNKCQKVIGIEIQRDVADMAQRSVMLNELSNVEIIHGDLKDVAIKDVDIVTCNPPYKEIGGGLLSEDDALIIARHEIAVTLEDVIRRAKDVLKFRGKFCMIHRPERLVDIFCLMRKYGIEPKRMRMVHPREGKPPNMVLIEGTNGGKAKLICEEPLFVHDGDGYSAEINRIYVRKV